MVLAFTVQEEIGLRGARTAAFAVRPDVAVVVERRRQPIPRSGGGAPQVCLHRRRRLVISFMDKRTLYDGELYRQILAIAEKTGLRAQPKTVVAAATTRGRSRPRRRGRGGGGVAALPVYPFPLLRPVQKGLE